MNDATPTAIVIERNISRARMTELGVHGWPTWKDGVGSRTLANDAAEKSYFLAGEAILTVPGGQPVTVTQGDLVTVPAGTCLWQVLNPVRRHYRSEALSPACCII